MKTTILIFVLLFPSLAIASPSSARARAIIAVLDAAEDTFQPELPNDFDKTGEAASSGPQSGPADAIADAVASKLSGPLDAQNTTLERLTGVLDTLSGKIAVLNTPAPPRVNAALPDTEKATPPAVPVVTVLCQYGCIPCDNQKADTADYKAIDFRRTYDTAKYAAWLQGWQAAGEGFPFLIWTGAGGKQFHTHGWPGLAAWLRRYNASLKQAAVGATSVAAPSAGNSPPAARFWLGNAAPGFTSMAQLRQHVAEEHRHGWRAVNRMSDAQVIQWHDAAHGWGKRMAATKSGGYGWSLSCGSCGRG